MKVCRPVLLALLFAAVGAAVAEEKIHWDVVQQIREEAFANSDALENASWLADVFGPRHVKTPAYYAAAQWAQQKLIEYGLDNAVLEPYYFGTGWENRYTSVHMMAPQYMPIIAYPAPWSAPTPGKVTGHAVYLNFENITSQDDLAPFRGKLQNAVVFIHPQQTLSPRFDPIATTFTEEQLDEMSQIKIAPEGPAERRPRRERSRPKRLSRQEISEFVFAEGALVLVRTDGQSDFGTVNAGVVGFTNETAPWEEGKPPNPTELVIAAEHYNRILRILEKEIPVELELDIRVNFTHGDPNDHNVVAEIPGTDLAHEIVVFGAHLQADHNGTGATDDAAGCVVALEVARIFKRLDLKPRRTVRIGLWGAHEMGTFGNNAHVAENFADPTTKEYKKDYNNLSAYFNVDHGSGKIRGVSVMGSEVVRSIFSEWIKPLHALGMRHLFETGMAHESYSSVGLPGYYFLQDRMDMETNVHSNMDVFDRLVEENLKVNTVILATFVYHAAMRDENLPRVAPLPW